MYSILTVQRTRIVILSSRRRNMYCSKMYISHKVLRSYDTFTNRTEVHREFSFILILSRLVSDGDCMFVTFSLRISSIT